MVLRKIDTNRFFIEVAIIATFLYSFCYQILYKTESIMPRIQLDQDIKPLSEFRANVGSCIQQVHTTRRPLVITQHGKSAAVLLDVAEYEALMERVELFEEIQLAERQVAEGHGVDHETARRVVLGQLKR